MTDSVLECLACATVLAANAPSAPYCPRCDDDLSHLHVLFYKDLRCCGCGNPEEVYALVRDLLELAPFYERWREVRERIVGTYENGDGAYYLVLYVLDDAGLIEHGGSVGGSWLTKKGSHYLPLLKRYEWGLINEAGYPHDGAECGPDCTHWQNSLEDYQKERILKNP